MRCGLPIGLMLAGLAAHASSAPLPAAPALGAAQWRSAPGAPLDVRVELNGAAEPLDAACFRVVPRVARGEWQLTLVELRRERYLRIVNRELATPPGASFEFRIENRCADQSQSDARARDYLLIAQGVAPPPLMQQPTVDESRYALPGGSLTVRPGDRLGELARRFYPGDTDRQKQFVLALRAHNPGLPPVPDEDELPRPMELRLPDLKSLSGIVPAQTFAMGREASRKIKAQASRPPAARQPGSGGRAARRPAALPTGPSPAPVASQAVGEAAGTANRTASVSSAAGPLVPRLRLSSAELDLAPSRAVSEEARRLLRERRAILDADDQLAAMLSLQNAVRQLQSRLAVLEAKNAHEVVVVKAPEAGRPDLKPAETLAARAAQAVAPPAVASAVAVADAKPAAEAKPGPSAAGRDVAVPPAAGVRPDAERPRQPPAKAQPEAQKAGSLLPEVDTTHALGAAGVLALLALLWAWARRRPARPAAGTAVRADLRAAGRGLAGAESADAASVGSPDVRRAADTADVERMPSPSTDLGPPTQPPADPEPIGMGGDHQATVRMDAVPVLQAQAEDDSPARFDLDPTPAATLDLALDDRPDEDRIRRLQYMYERFPELMSRTVSIDEADTVVNAARLYYEEGQADRACELLTFGVEERPQEVRFWLAQFEIYRLDQRAAEFSALAAKFHVLFSYSPAWPKVRRIGHELDPANPLFAAGRDVLASDAFDPVAENWLNAPMDFTAEALMSDLRRDLLEEHNVDRADFDTLPARLAPTA